MHHVHIGNLNPVLKNFLEMNLPKVKAGKSSKFALGVADEKLGGSIQDAMNLKVEKSNIAIELLRGIRLHFATFVKGMK
jgi:nucleolar protein 56